MKKLLLLVAASSALTLTACGSSNLDTLVTGDKSEIQIGESSFTKQDIYEVLKLAQGGTIVTNWFREAIYMELEGSTAEAVINTRVNFLWEEFTDTILYPETIKSSLEAKKYFCGTDATCADAIASYKKDVLKPSAIDELFTEYYLKEATKAEEDYFKEYQPRHVWAIQKDTLSNIETTVSSITSDLEFAKNAAYFHHGKSLIGDPKYYNDDQKYLGNKLETYAKKGILKDANYYAETFDAVLGTDYESSGRYLKTGSLGTILNTNSTLPSSITKHLFNENLKKSNTENKAPAQDANTYKDAWINNKGILEFKEEETTIDADGKVNGETSKFFTETGDTHYIVKAERVDFDSTGEKRAEARRQIAKVSTVKTKAQNQLFKKFKLEAWDQKIWDAIESTILANKD